MKQRVAQEAAVSEAKTELATDSLEDKLASLETEDAIDRLLSEVKSRRHANG